MKTIRIFMFFCLPTMLLTACCWNSEDTYINFKDDDQLLIYDVGDTLIYTSDLGNVDTFYVANIEEEWKDAFSNEANSPENYCNTYTYDRYRDYLFNTYPTNDKNVSISVFQDASGAFKFYSWHHMNCQYSYDHTEIIQSFELNNNTYQNIYYYNYTYAFPIWYYFSKEYGLLKYCFDETETWTLSEIIFKNKN